MQQKIRVGILFGGRSSEHEVSLQSAKNIIEALDKEKYEPVLIGIDKQGKWHLNDQANYVLNETNPELIKLNASNVTVALLPGWSNGSVVDTQTGSSITSVDVVFPVLHGTYGEDGSVQGLLKLADVAFVGADILGSAIGMDKDVAKRLLRDAGVPVARFVTYRHPEEADFATVQSELGLPVFVKPANAGSSVGVSKVRNAEEFQVAIREAFSFDTKVLVEEAIVGREIECSILGNDEPVASVPGEIILNSEFYSYEAKYIDANAATTAIPAKDLTNDQIEEIRTVATHAFKVLECAGLARVDFFLSKQGKLYLNEINTIPGFTKISMYPKLWEATGISYAELIDRLITLAIARHQKQRALQTNYLK